MGGRSGGVVGGLVHVGKDALKVVVMVLELALQVILQVCVVVSLVLKGRILSLHVCLLALQLSVSLLGLVMRRHYGGEPLG